MEYRGSLAGRFRACTVRDSTREIVHCNSIIAMMVAGPTKAEADAAVPGATVSSTHSITPSSFRK